MLLNTAGVQTPSLSGFPLFNNKFLMYFSEKGRLKLLNMSHYSLAENVAMPKHFGWNWHNQYMKVFIYFTNIRVIRKTKICLYKKLLFFSVWLRPYSSVKDGCKRNFCLRFCLFHHRCLWQTSKPGKYDNYVT